MEVDKEGKGKRVGIAGGKERTLMLVLPGRYLLQISPTTFILRVFKVSYSVAIRRR
jgi:hypothetical protein